jgi:hypothetical protein
MPAVSVSNLEELLRSAGGAFPLVTIHREQVDATVCWIGRVLHAGGGRVIMLEIKPDATWEKKPTTFRLSEITCVAFGGDYVGALALVGGSAYRQVKRAPQPRPKDRWAARASTS